MDHQGMQDIANDKQYTLFSKEDGSRTRLISRSNVTMAKEILQFTEMHEIELTHRYPRQFVPISRSSRPLWIPMKGLRWGWAAQGLLLPFRPSSSSVIDWLIDWYLWKKRKKEKMTLMRSHIIKRTNAKKVAEFPWYLNEANQTSSLKCKYKYRLVAPLFFGECKIQELLFNLRFHNSAEIHGKKNEQSDSRRHSLGFRCVPFKGAKANR